MLEGADHGDQVALLLVVFVNIAEIGIDQRIAVGKEECRIHFALQQAKPAAGAHKLFFVYIFHIVIFFQIVKIRFDHVLFIVDHQFEILAAEIPEAVDD